MMSNIPQNQSPFSASFAKWWYHTTPAPLKKLCRTYVYRVIRQGEQVQIQLI